MGACPMCTVSDSITSVELRQGNSVRVGIRCGICRSQPAIGSVTFNAGSRGQEVSHVRALRRVGKNWSRPPGVPFVVMAQDRQLRIVKRHEGSRVAEQTVQGGEERAIFRCFDCGARFDYARRNVVTVARNAAIAGRREVALRPGTDTGPATNQKPNLLRNTN